MIEPPSNTLLPVVSGLARPGSILVVDVGRWSDSPEPPGYGSTGVASALTLPTALIPVTVKPIIAPTSASTSV